MRFLHTADWHLGKKLHGYELLEDQKEALEQILALALKEKVDALVVAGDLYDRKIPNGETISLLNDFLYRVNITHQIPILAISGNHDSSVRLGSGAPWFLKDAFYLQTQLKDVLTPVEIEDTQFFLLPYFERYEVEIAFDLEEFPSLDASFTWLLAEMKKRFKPDKKHVLIAHFFAAGAKTTDSETKLQVGGLQAFSLPQLEIFDYVALGHLHNPKAISHPFIAYSGSLLPYSLSEAGQKKQCIIVDTKELKMEKHVITPKREVVRLTGSFDELTAPAMVEKNRDCFVGLHVTDEQVIPNLMARCREKYPYILELTRKNYLFQEAKAKKELPIDKPDEIFKEFFETTTKRQLSTIQEKTLTDILAIVEKRGE